MQASRRTLATILAMAVVLMAAPAGAGGATVARGAFETFADGPTLGYDVSGVASMVRTADGKTIVSVNVTGLIPGANYGSHVHNQTCAEGSAGGHYRFDGPVAGGALDGFEIWPGPFKANPAGNAHGKTTVHATAGADAVSVVIHAPAPTSQKIACADLS
ncbi:MAG TPA: hypothetical protein VMS99_01265 [Acidimicrobiia bacterium]|nr:hypothetical protein [Acidimicrobiia bacterium]